MKFQPRTKFAIDRAMLKEARKELNITRGEAAGFCGITLTKYVQLEEGKGYVMKGLAYRVCDAFGLDRDEALHVYEMPTTEPKRGKRGRPRKEKEDEIYG